MKRIYLSGDKAKSKFYKEKLDKLGYHTTYYEGINDEKNKINSSISFHRIQSVAFCSIFILFPHSEGIDYKLDNDCFIELGVALGLLKDVYVLGILDNKEDNEPGRPSNYSQILYNYPSIDYIDEWDKLIEKIKD